MRRPRLRHSFPVPEVLPFEAWPAVPPTTPAPSSSPAARTPAASSTGKVAPYWVRLTRSGKGDEEDPAEMVAGVAAVVGILNGGGHLKTSRKAAGAFDSVRIPCIHET